MDFRELAQQELSHYDTYAAAIEALSMEVMSAERSIKELYYTKTKLNGAGEEIEHKIDELYLKRADAFVRLNDTRGKLMRTERALEALSKEERTTLRHDPESSPEDICFSLNIERATYYRMKSRALEKFTRAMYGVVMT